MPTVALPTFRVRPIPFVSVYRPTVYIQLGVCASSNGIQHTGIDTIQHIGIDKLTYSSVFYCVARSRLSGGAPSNVQIKTFYINEF